MAASSSVGLHKFALRALHADIYNALVIGVIVGTQRPRVLTGKMKDNVDRAVWNFTLRDSVQDYINVSCWATSVDITNISNLHHIGDVIEISKPRIEIRRISDYGEQFRPMVTSPYNLTIGDPMEQIRKYEGIDIEEYRKFLNFPTKPLASFVTLANALLTSNSNRRESVDLLVALRTVGEVRHVTTKEGNQIQVRDVTIFDDTNPGTRVSIWEPEYIRRADFWKARTTILFMTDMRIQYNDFAKCKVANLTTRTIITEDPSGPEVDALRNYAMSAALLPSAILDSMAGSIPDINSIQNVMSINQIHLKMQQLIASDRPSTDDSQFTALLFAVVTMFDLDGFSRVITTKCAQCKSLLEEPNPICTNKDCPVGMGMAISEPETTFGMSLSLSDQTGSLTGCRLSGATAENILRCSVHDFLKMSDEDKEHLKWQYLLERCSIRIMVLCVPGRRPIISILSLEIASPAEVAKRLPHY